MKKKNFFGARKSEKIWKNILDRSGTPPCRRKSRFAYPLEEGGRFYRSFYKAYEGEKKIFFIDKNIFKFY